MMALEVVGADKRSARRANGSAQRVLFCAGLDSQSRERLAPGELITSVTLPRLANGTRSHYLKRRDRASYEFALASAAVVAQMQGNRFTRVRIALGGVGTQAVALDRSRNCARNNHEASTQNFRKAARRRFQGAKAMPDNAFKIELAKRTLVRAFDRCEQRSLAV